MISLCGSIGRGGRSLAQQWLSVLLIVGQHMLEQVSDVVTSMTLGHQLHGESDVTHLPLARDGMRAVTTMNWC